MICSYCTKVCVRLHVFWEQERWEKPCVWGRSERNEKGLHVANHGLVHEASFWKTPILLQPVFFSTPSTKVHKTRAQRKDVPPRDVEKFWVHCPAVLCPLC